MSILATRQPKSKSRPKPQRFFGITFTTEGDSYAISRLPAHPEVARHASRFRKLTSDQAGYDVRQTEHGMECECMGFQRHGHKTLCKHIATIQAAATVFSLA